MCNTKRGGSIFTVIALAAFGFAALIPGARAQSCFTVSPSSLQLNFGQLAVGTQAPSSQSIIIVNNCSTSLDLTSFSISPSEFKLRYGWAPESVNPGQRMQYGILFAPDSAQAFNGTFTINIKGCSPVVISLTGTGFITKAAISITPANLAFGSQPIGRAGRSQTVTYKNTGTQGMSISSIYADPPFSVTGFTNTVILKPGQSLPVQVSFTPSAVGNDLGTLVMVSNMFPPKGVSLSGTGVAPNTLAVSTYPVLPGATSSFAYQATLAAAGGMPPYNWSFAGASLLPSGLALSSTGVITGTTGPHVSAGNYRFTVQVTDSSVPPNTTTAVLHVPVSAPNGAECQNIIFDVPGTSTPILALNDLGGGYYEGVQGGLYFNGSNTMPASHDADGVNLASSVQPLDASGNPDPNGKIGLLSVGLSVTFDTFEQFTQDAIADPSVNSALVFVPGAQPRLGAVQFANPNDGGWNAIMDNFLPQAGVTANQVEVVWFEDIDAHPTGTFPSDLATLEDEYISIAENLHSFFPNLKLAYFSTRFYAGYSNGRAIEPDPETYAYETGFAVRAVIQDQINGDPALNYNSANGPVMAPWIGWGPYDWANGMLGRSDGLVWSCSQYRFDGTHMVPAGKEVEANLLLNFFKSTDTATPWFLAPLQ